MHHHPETLLALHKQRQTRLEREAARDALVRSLTRRRVASPPTQFLRRRWKRRSASSPIASAVSKSVFE